MRIVLVSPAFLVLYACSLSQRSPAVAPKAPLDFTVAYAATTAQLTLHVAQPGYVIIIEQAPDGEFAMLPLDSAPTFDSLAPGQYRISVARHFPLTPPAVPASPNPPCWEDRPGERIWTGFCGISPGWATATRELASFPAFLPVANTHRVIALKSARPIGGDGVLAILDPLPTLITSEALVRQLRARLAPTDASLAWAAIHVSPREWK